MWGEGRYRKEEGLCSAFAVFGPRRPDTLLGVVVVAAAVGAWCRHAGTLAAPVMSGLACRRPSTPRAGITH